VLSVETKTESLPSLNIKTVSDRRIKGSKLQIKSLHFLRSICRILSVAQNHYSFGIVCTGAPVEFLFKKKRSNNFVDREKKLSFSTTVSPQTLATAIE